MSIRIRLVLADDHVIFLDALGELLGSKFSIVESVIDGRSLIMAAERLRPDIVLSEVRLPVLSGLDACEYLRRSAPESKTLFLSANDNSWTAKEALQRGAFGFVSKRASPAELFNAIHSAASGIPYANPNPAGTGCNRSRFSSS